MKKEALFRLMDCNINRAAEGLRVIEDFVRFFLENKVILDKLRDMRHRLRTLSCYEFISSREADLDIGKEFTPTFKDNIKVIIEGNTARVAEALRTLEEFAPNKEEQNLIFSLRYSFYSIEKELWEAINKKGLHSFNKLKGLYLIVDTELLNNNINFLDKLLPLIDEVNILQLRAKSLPDDEFYNWAAKIRNSRKDLCFIINDRVDIALAIGANGVHLGEKDLPVNVVKKLLGPFSIVGRTIHSLEELDRLNSARLLGLLSYIAVGPIFSSSTKPSLKPKGIQFISSVLKKVRSLNLPVFGIGGINLKNINKLKNTGLDGFAVASAILKSPDLKETLKKFTSIQQIFF
jgi:thiamine-phosphate pyrophosphorylase